MIFKSRFTVSLSAISFLIILSLLISCGNDKDDTITIPDTIVFNGITETDNNGWVIKNDPTDWALSESWNEKENSLFTEMKVNTCSNGNSDYVIHPSYLNPCNNGFSLSFTKPAESRFAFRIVDRNYNVILSVDSVYSNGLSIDVQGFNIVNDTVRMYYKFIGLDCEMKGHGDIKILN